MAGWAKLIISLLLALVMSVLRLEFPGVLVSPLHIVDAYVTQDFLQVDLEKDKYMFVKKTTLNSPLLFCVKKEEARLMCISNKAF